MNEIKKPKELNEWDFLDTVTVSDGCDFKLIPDVSKRNFNKLLDEYNNLVKVVNLICEKHGIELEK